MAGPPGDFLSPVLDPVRLARQELLEGDGPVARPHPVRAAEVRNARLGGDAGAGETHDAGRARDKVTGGLHAGPGNPCGLLVSSSRSVRHWTRDYRRTAATAPRIHGTSTKSRKSVRWTGRVHDARGLCVSSAGHGRRESRASASRSPLLFRVRITGRRVPTPPACSAAASSAGASRTSGAARREWVSVISPQIELAPDKPVGVGHLNGQ